jgi:hypothetical protein
MENIKTMLIYICAPVIILAILGLGFNFLISNNSQKTQTDGAKVENGAVTVNNIEFEPAKAMRDPLAGSALVFTKQASLGGTVFLFTDENKKDLFAAMYVQNLNVDWPSWEIVKGQSRDWLKVTTIASDGTGFMLRKDTWYVLGFGRTEKVLSYPSNGSMNPNSADSTKDSYFTTESVVSDNDREVKILTHYVSCPQGMAKTDPNCKKQTHTEFYSWDDKTNTFRYNTPNAPTIHAKIKTDLGWDWGNGF